ncbi:MAG: MFS transporter [Myxococcota bacterium]
MAVTTAPMPGGFAGWRMVRVAFLVDFIAVGFFFYSFGIFYPAIAADFGEGFSQVATGIAVCNFVGGIFGPFVGRALDRRPLKHMMIVGALVVSAGFACLSQTTELWQYYLVLGSFFAFGLGMMGGMASSKLVANWFERERGKALGIATMGVSLSGLVMPTVATWLRDEWGWREGFLVYAIGILVIVVPVVALFVVTRPEDLGQRPDGDGEGEGAPLDPSVDRVWRTREILRSPDFWLIALPFAMVFSALSAILVHIAPYAADMGFVGYQPAAVLSVGAGAGVLGKVFFGWLVDRGDPRFAVLVSFGIQIIGLGLIMNANAYAALLAGGVVFGFGMGGVVPLQGAVSGQAFGRFSFGSVLGLMRPVQVPLHAVGIPFAAWIRDTTGSFEIAFWIFLGVYGFSCLLIAGLRPARSSG